MEAGVTQRVSRTLLEEVTFDQSNVTSTDWSTYPILTFVAAPVIETVLIDRPEIPATGAGEPACNPVPAAIANAVCDAIGGGPPPPPPPPGRGAAARKKGAMPPIKKKTKTPKMRGPNPRTSPSHQPQTPHPAPARRT